MCGDLADNGLAREPHVLAEALRPCLERCRVLAVLGNDDHESGEILAVSTILAAGGDSVLDGNAEEVHGIGFTGVKGFAGGVVPHELGAWGETTIKAFVENANDEALKLEYGLAQLKASTNRIVLLHYSSIRMTVEGQSVEIYSFLGSSHLERVLDRYQVSADFHGHAHHGQRGGHPKGKIPVHSVSMQALAANGSQKAPLRWIEIEGV